MPLFVYHRALTIKAGVEVENSDKEQNEVMPHSVNQAQSRRRNISEPKNRLSDEERWPGGRANTFHVRGGSEQGLRIHHLDEENRRKSDDVVIKSTTDKKSLSPRSILGRRKSATALGPTSAPSSQAKTPPQTAFTQTPSQKTTASSQNVPSLLLTPAEPVQEHLLNPTPPFSPLEPPEYDSGSISTFSPLWCRRLLNTLLVRMIQILRRLGL